MDQNVQGQERTLSFGLQYIVAEHGNRKEMEVHVGVEDVGTTDHSLIWTEANRRKPEGVGGVGSCRNGESIS